MDLHELGKTVAKVREIISKHEANLSSSLANTRQAVIAPVLQALDWDITNPDQHIAEYKPSHLHDVCALIGAATGAPLAVLVTKPLRQNVSAYEVNGAAALARKIRAPYFGGTDGIQWKIYQANNVILEVDITQGPPTTVAAALAPLWKEAMAGDVTPIPPTGDENHGLSTTKTVATLTGDDPLPATMTFPDGHQHSVKNWKGYTIGAAQWLYDTGRVDEAKIVAQGGEVGTLFIPPQEQTSDRKFKARNNKIRGNVWSKVSYNRGHHVKAAQRNLKANGVDPAEVAITFHEASANA